MSKQMHVKPECIPLSLRRKGFESRAVRVGFVVDKVTLGQVLRVFPINYHSNNILY
jgi:hypothetical protein